MIHISKQDKRTASLVVVTFTYLLIGAAVFDALESEFETAMSSVLSEEERNLTQKYGITEKDFEDLKENVISSVPHKAGTQWKFSGAFYFALTVITMIGYGHSTPRTLKGKLFCMFYAISGIPLCIVMFQSVGERLNIFNTFLLKRVKKSMKWKNTDVSQTDQIFLTGVLSVIVLNTGAAVFMHFEKWDYLDAFYYCFITLTTIGFGDFVALQTPGADTLTHDTGYVTFCLVFILFGLTVVSAAMNLLILRFLIMNTVEEHRKQLEDAAAAKCMVTLDGDIIVSNGNVVSGAQEMPMVGQADDDTISVCSCSCYNLRSRAKLCHFSMRSGGLGRGAISHPRVTDGDESEDGSDSHKGHNSSFNRRASF